MGRVIRFEFPTYIIALFDVGMVSINNPELAANFFSERTAKSLLPSNITGLNSWFGSNNTAQVLWKTKKAARAESNFMSPHKFCVRKGYYNDTQDEARRTSDRYQGPRTSWATSPLCHSTNIQETQKEMHDLHSNSHFITLSPCSLDTGSMPNPPTRLPH
jgi:hypothetical protein